MLTGSSDWKSTVSVFPTSQPWPDFLPGWEMACAVCYLQRVWPGQLPASSVSTSVSGASAGRVAAMWCQITSCALWSDKEECCWTGNHFLYDAFWRLFALNSGRIYVMSKQHFGWTHVDNVYISSSKISCLQSAWVCSAKEAPNYKIEM